MIEAHFRGLQALGVDENTYLSVAFSAIMQKLPELLQKLQEYETLSLRT